MSNHLSDGSDQRGKHETLSFVEANGTRCELQPLRGMLTLRGSLRDKALQSVCERLVGVSVPQVACTGHYASEGQGLLWMSPDELMLMMPYDHVQAAREAIDGALTGTHYLCENVSDARVIISVSGPFSREVLAKLTPVNMHPDYFKAGQITRTKLGQVAAAVSCLGEARFEVMCFRSVSDYLFTLIKASIMAGPVSHFPVS